MKISNYSPSYNRMFDTMQRVAHKPAVSAIDKVSDDMKERRQESSTSNSTRDFLRTMYMAESEGLLPTRASKINAVIRAIKDNPKSEIDLFEFQTILEKFDLSYDTLSDKEIDYINNSIK